MTDELTELPEGWTWANLEEASERIVDCPHSTAKFLPKGKFCIDTTCIEPGKIVFEKARYVSDETYQQRTQRLVPQAGDILFSREGTIGIAAIVPESIELCLGQRMMMFRPASYITSNYFLWSLMSPVFKNQVKPKIIGTTSPHINIRDLKEMVIPVPPLNEQKRIVAKIEELRDRLHRSKQALEDVPKLCDRFRQSVLAAAFQGDLTADWREENSDVEPASVLAGKADNSLPDTWCFASIGDVIQSLKYGTSQKSDYEIEGVPVLRIPNIGHGYVDHTDLKYADLSPKEVEELKLIPGDILLIRSNGSVSLVGKSAVVSNAETGFVYAGYLIRLRLNPLLVNSKYLHLCLLSRDLRLQIEIPARSTSGVHNINSQEVKKLKIPLPPLEEQEKIVRIIESLFKATDALRQQYEESIVQLDRLNQSILAKAFRGELAEQDPNDEPASVLLDRIRAERQAQEGKKSGGAKGKRKKASSDQLDLPGVE